MASSDVSYSTQRLKFWSRKVFEGLHITCETCFEKASLVHFFSLRNSGLRVKRQVWSTLKLFEKTSLLQIRRKIWTKLAFSKTSPIRDSIYSKKASLVQIFLRIWSKLAFSNNFKVDQTCLLTRDPEFRSEKKWTKLAFSKQVSHVIWTPSNTFLDQNIRRWVIVDFIETFKRKLKRKQNNKVRSSSLVEFFRLLEFLVLFHFILKINPRESFMYTRLGLRSALSVSFR